jgi:hypothetical protein
MRQRVGIDDAWIELQFTLQIRWKNWRRATRYFADADIKHENGGLKNVQTNNLFYKVASGDDDKQTCHHQGHKQPIIGVCENEIPIKKLGCRLGTM